MYMDTLQKSALFDGIPTAEIPIMLSSLSSYDKKYDKGATILWEGDVVQDVGILLSGSARSTKTDINGKLVMVTLLEPGSYIGLLLAAGKSRRSPVSVEALEPLHVMFIPMKNIIRLSDCPHHSILLSNLLDGIAEKALVLHDRNDCLIKPTIRHKVLTYLNTEAKRASASSFYIPLGREAMAEYLDVDRSALSRELSRMKQDCIIDFHKNWFCLL